MKRYYSNLLCSEVIASLDRQILLSNDQERLRFDIRARFELSDPHVYNHASATKDCETSGETSAFLSCLWQMQRPWPRLCGQAGCGDWCEAETWKIACRCGKKHILSENAKTDSLGALFEVLVSKIVRRWPKAHFQVKMIKTDGLETLFEVLMSKNGAVLWRQAHFQVKMFKFRCRTISQVIR